MDIYQQSRVNRAMIVFEEAVKGVFRAQGSTTSGLAPLRTGRDEMKSMLQQSFIIHSKEELERVK